MNEELTGLTATLVIWLDDEHAHLCTVSVWDSPESFVQQNPDMPSYVGCCKADWLLNKKTNERKADQKFAEIHLVLKFIGAGYVAHEIQHLISYWCDFKGWNWKQDDELIARFAEKVTCDFWTKFYERFEAA